MFRITLDENLWLMIEIDRLLFLDLQVLNLGIVLVATALVLRGRKLYKTRNLRKS